jgi:CBS domain-containing protein
MKRTKVSALMIPLDDYATIGPEATLYDAVVRLEACDEKLDNDRVIHRSVLVLDDSKEVVGILTQFEMIRALEPKYTGIAKYGFLSHHGVNVDFIRSLVKDQGLWQDTLENICSTASHIHVADVMDEPHPEMFVPADSSLDEAMHQMVMGRLPNLLCTEGGKVAGVLRIADAFDHVCRLIKSCAI